MSAVRLRHGVWVALLATATVVGCLLVAPLGDRGDATSAGTTSSGAAGDGIDGGSSTNAGSGTGGSAGVGVGGSSGGTSTSGGCMHNADCSVEGGADEPYLCTDDHRCLALKSAGGECPLVYGNWADDNAIVFGAFVSLNPADPANSPVLLAYQLAQEEFDSDAQVGLPILGVVGKARPLVMVVCNSDPAMVDGAMKHLAGDGADALGVSAILADMMPGDLNRAYTNYRPGQIFYMNATGSNRTLLDAPHNGLMWHMLGQPSDLAPAYAETVRLAEQYVRDLRGVGTRPLKVAVVTTTEAFDSELSDFVVPALRFNGKDATENANDGNYLGVTVDLANPKPSDDGARICAFLPDIVVSTAGEVFTQPAGVLAKIEMLWGSCFALDAAIGLRPFYILSPIDFGSLSYVKQIIQGQMMVGPTGTATDPQASRRFIGISAARAADPTVYNAFALRLASRFKGAGDPESENFYDAFYYLAYAMYGAGSVDKLTGPGIGAGMLRLIDGPTSYDVGPVAMTDVFSALSVANAHIRLNGTLGPANFDRTTGARVDVGSVFCFDDTSVVHPQVLRYDPTPDDRSPGRFTGTFPCFDGFFR